MSWEAEICVPKGEFGLKIHLGCDDRLDWRQAFCVGSPTNNNMLPTVGAFLTYLKGLALKDRSGLAFGSYGWNDQRVDQMVDVLLASSFQMLPAMKTQYVPEESTLRNITEQLKGAIV